MFRYGLTAIVALLLCAVTLFAADYPKATLTAIDMDKSTVTFTVPPAKEGDKAVEKTMSFNKDSIKLLNAKDKPLKMGLEAKQFSKKNLKKGVDVSITTDKVKDGDKEKEVVTTIKLNPKTK